ncbi:hypothetical protein AwWohl_10170 [Gammaproteobacteria bacterium]|nr:hypothetical protein AwWohl_10170 [Gammaproteobacteria bacterium]
MWDRYPEYKPRKTVAADNQKKLEKLIKKNPKLHPIKIEGKKLAETWWGLAWNKNLEAYSDYSNRIGRGRSYVRGNAVFDLQVQAGLVTAIVQGSRSKPYEIKIKIEPLSPLKWEYISAACSNKIANIEALAEGKFPEALANLFTDPKNGLFPSPKEIKFECSCPDWADMCKHVAAALYGVGARFDHNPALLFTLRDINFEGLLKKSIAEKMQNMLKNVDKKSKRIMTKVNINAVFDI